MTTSEKQLDFNDLESALGANFLNSLVNISIVDKFIWMKNPKVGSSTLDITLQAVAGRSLSSVCTKPHSSVQDSVFVKPYQLPINQLERILSSDIYFKFTFVRNPYNRLFSAYNDKIVGNKRNKVQILRLLGLDKTDLEQSISFAEFIDALSNIEPLKMDRHWMPQSLITSVDSINYNYIGKLESFDEDLKYVFSKLGLEIEEYYTYYAPHRNKSGSKIADHLNDQETLDKINKIYLDDFKNFDYRITQKASKLEVA